jgi:NTP pyrophosphatase (non-canonical NTP hydrolase)
MSAFTELQRALERFYESREWRQFQTPKDVAASLAVEASEVQELFLWLDVAEQARVLDERREDLKHELADVIINCLNLAHLGRIDLDAAVREKLRSLSEKYPADAVRGKVMPHR